MAGTHALPASEAPSVWVNWCPGAGPIRHALKVNLYAARNLHYDEETRGYRWPARKADGYAARTYGTKGTAVQACRMGAQGRRI